jgi:hypothetical protein
MVNLGILFFCQNQNSPRTLSQETHIRKDLVVTRPLIISIRIGYEIKDMYSLNHVLKDSNVALSRLNTMPARTSSSPEINIAIRVGSIGEMYHVFDLNCDILEFGGCRG